MIECNRVYHLKSSLNGIKNCYCIDGMDKRKCPGCCMDCKYKTECDEPNKCTTPDDKGVDTND